MFTSLSLYLSLYIYSSLSLWDTHVVCVGVKVDTQSRSGSLVGEIVRLTCQSSRGKIRLSEYGYIVL